MDRQLPRLHRRWCSMGKTARPIAANSSVEGSGTSVSSKTVPRLDAPPADVVPNRSP
ncbi:MAG TPA: hypothetical protein VHY91_02020 [Pirellulales bacterium]|nr:hypothetical protein [Pirellulales bacterium]